MSLPSWPSWSARCAWGARGPRRSRSSSPSAGPWRTSPPPGSRTIGRGSAPSAWGGAWDGSDRATRRLAGRGAQDARDGGARRGHALARGGRGRPARRTDASVRRAADVIVIGGGVTGASIAFHLTSLGVRDVRVLERRFLAAGGTGGSVGIIRQLYPTPETSAMVLRSLRVFQRFADAVGGDAGYVACGALIGVSRAMRPALEATLAVQRALGIRAELLEPAELLRVEPRIDASGLGAVLHEPESGYGDPMDPELLGRDTGLDEATPVLERTGRALPRLAEARYRQGYAGAFDITPDWMPILDESPVRGFWIAAGMSGHGFKLAPAVGEMMAALITRGTPPVSALPFALARFTGARPEGTFVASYLVAPEGR